MNRRTFIKLGGALAAALGIGIRPDAETDQILWCEECGSATLVGGRTFYMSPDGDDSNDGLTPDSAFRTFEAVNRQVSNGDVVYLRSIYDDGELYDGCPGLTVDTISMPGGPS